MAKESRISFLGWSLYLGSSGKGECPEITKIGNEQMEKYRNW